LGKKTRRGRERLVTCESCGQRQPKSHTRSIIRRGRKINLCIHCAKKRGVIGRYSKKRTKVFRPR